MADLITIAQLEASYGDVDVTLAAGIISDVSALVVSYVESIDNDSDNPIDADTWDSTSTPDAVQAVVKHIVFSVLQNPVGYTGENLGDHGWQSNPRSRLGPMLGRLEKRAIRQAVAKPAYGEITLEGYLPVEPLALTDGDLGL